MIRRTPPPGATPPLEGLLAGLRLAIGAGNASAQRAGLLKVGDWPGLGALAAYHRVSGLFLRGVANAGVRVPDQAVAGALTRMRQRDAVRGLRQLAAMHRITAALDAAAIPSLVLKGLPLGQRAYGDPFVKSAIDVDLLVPEDVVPAAANVLRTLGWRRVMPAFRETPLRRRWYDSVQKDDAFTGGRAKVELHRRLFNNRSLFNPSFDRLQAAAATVAIGTRRFRTLDDADQLLYLACHGALHFWYRLKWLCDFAALVGVMDRETVRRALADGRRAGLGTVLASALRLCREDLQAEIPAAGAGAPAPGPRERFVVALSRRVWTRRGVRRLGPTAAMRMGRGFLAGGLRYHLHEARSLLIAHGDFARVDLPDRLFCLYPLVRPASLAERIFRGRL